MVVKVLGTGCAGCKALYENAKQAIADLGADITLVKEEDIMKIMDYNVMSLPALVVDEKVVTTGKRLTVAEVKEILSK